jgi:hypothetical protein
MLVPEAGSVSRTKCETDRIAALQRHDEMRQVNAEIASIEVTSRENSPKRLSAAV